MKKQDEILQDFRDKIDAIPDIQKKVNEILEFCNIYGDTLGPRISEVMDLSIELSRKANYEVGEIVSFYNLLFFRFMTEGKVNSRYVDQVPNLPNMLEKLKNYPEWYAFGLNLQSYIHWFAGEYDKGFNMAYEALKMADKIPVHGRGWTYFSLGVFHFDTKDFENSRINYQAALDIFNADAFDYGRARASTGLASIAIIQNRNEEAIALMKFSENVYRSLSHHSGLSRTLNDMGVLEKAKGNYENAVVYLKESIELRTEIEHLQGLITSYTELGETYLLTGHHQQALEEFEKGLALSLRVKSAQKQMRLHKLLYDAYKALGNVHKALENFEFFYEIKSKLLSDEASNNIKRVQTQFEKEKSEQLAEMERLRNIELKKASDIIEQKNKDITDSINYAKRIQLGILPPKTVTDACFNDYFILYKPKDIVSGDFYWAVASENRETKEKLAIVAAVDCTGHGVPGAFMSMLGNTLLNQTIFHPEIVSPGDVLDFLNEKLPENLKSTGAEQHIRDGMDMGLGIFNLAKMQVEFAGANNPCWIVRKGELIELSPDKQAITASSDAVKKKFTTQTFALQKGDCIYLFTDGYADQFGGSKGKKFGYRHFRELLMSMHNQPMADQKNVLDKNFDDWKGQLEQIDDVCVIGIRV